MTKLRPYALALAASACVSACLIAFVTERYLRLSLSSELGRATQAARIQTLEASRVFNRDAMWYGIVQDVSVTEQVVVIDFADRFVAGSGRVVMRVKIAPDTKIAKQSLARSGETYIGFAEQTVASIADVRPNEKVAVVMHTDDTGNAVADILIVGGAL